MPPDTRPVVVHVMYRFDTGGLENGVVNLINQLPTVAYRHVVLALTEITDFKQRINWPDVEFIALHKPPGQGIWLFPKLYKIFRQIRPAIVHSRNLAALEVQFPAWLARVPVRIHGEHGRDVGDLDGNNRTNQRIRRFYKPFVHHYLALSHELANYLVKKIQVPASRITEACNGVNTTRFAPHAAGPVPIFGCPFDPAKHWLVGTVGRMQTVKDQTLLARSFVLALQSAPELKAIARLVMVGEGPLKAQAQAILESAGLSDLAWFPGERQDVSDVMRGLHCFVLPSLAEGISNTILEAMATALPVIATHVGGNADLVLHDQTGFVVPAGDPVLMSHSIIKMASNRDHAQALGLAGRQRVLQRFSLAAMVNTYQHVYDQQLRRISGLPRSN